MPSVGLAATPFSLPRLAREVRSTPLPPLVCPLSPPPPPYPTAVIAIDIDPAKIALAQNNAAVYGVADRIEFVVGDFFQLVDGLRADVVFLSPPWGGPDYMDEAVYDLELSRPTVAAMCAAARGISPNLCIFLPRNTDTEQLAALAPRGARLEVEQNFLNSKLKTVSVYFGELVKQPPRLPRALR